MKAHASRQPVAPNVSTSVTRARTIDLEPSPAGKAIARPLPRSKRRQTVNSRSAAVMVRMSAGQLPSLPQAEAGWQVVGTSQRGRAGAERVIGALRAVDRTSAQA